MVVLLFVLVHKIGDTMANLMTRDLLVVSGFSREEIAFGDVGIGFFALLAGIFVRALQPGLHCNAVRPVVGRRRDSRKVPDWNNRRRAH